LLSLTVAVAAALLVLKGQQEMRQETVEMAQHPASPVPR
jgi:hypothetical protein